MKVDYSFIVDAITEAGPEEADLIMRAYELDDYGDANERLGRAVRIQIKTYVQQIADIDAEADQPLKRGKQ